MQGVPIHLLRVPQRNAILRAFGPCQTGLDSTKIQLEHIAEYGIGRRVDAKEALLLGVGLDKLDVRLGPAGHAEILERFLINREEPHRRAILGRHISDCRAIGEGQPR